MSKRILAALDGGHGMETAGKRTPFIPEIGRVIKENEFNRAVVNLLAEELKRCGFDVLLVAPTDADTPLETRVARANAAKADVYISIHYDAFDSKFDAYDPEGITVFYAASSANGKRLAQCINEYLKRGTVQKDRGIKTAEYYVLRKTNMPAILSENGFMDNKREALLMIDPEFQREVAQEHAQGICKYFNVPYIQKTPVTIQKPPSGYSSASLEKAINVTLESATRRKIIVDAAVVAGMSPVWRTKLANDDITDMDITALAAETLVKLHT